MEKIKSCHDCVKGYKKSGVVCLIQNCRKMFYDDGKFVRTCKTCNQTEPCNICQDADLEFWTPIPPLTSAGQTCPPKPFTREDLTKEIHKSCDDIKKLFSYKNEDYGMNNDPFANFSKTAERVLMPIMQKNGVTISKRDAMFAVLMVYMDKHLVALSQTGLNGHEADERLGDVANYALIAKAMLKEG